VVEIEFVENGTIALIRFPKGLVALDRDTFIRGLKLGKKYERRRSLEARMTPTPYAENHQAPQGGSPTRGNDIVYASAAEHEVPQRAKEHVMTPLVIELPQFRSRLTHPRYSSPQYRSHVKQQFAHLE
jgi:hypothetical protein